MADRRRREAGKRHKRTPELIAWVEARLRDDWSPEQIAGSLREAGYPLVSHEWIYRHAANDGLDPLNGLWASVQRKPDPQQDLAFEYPDMR